MKDIEQMNIGELAAYVCDHLTKNGVGCVLSGGACVSIYTFNQYQSFDIDLIENSYNSRKRIKELMNKIGFIEKNRYFINPETQFYVEFPPGPLSIGSEPVKDINKISFDTGLLRLLTPTDCVKDRLAAYYFWEDKQALDQAIMVSKEALIDYSEIQRWSIVENCEIKYHIFSSLLK